VEDGYAVKVDGLKLTFYDERVAFSVSTQALLQLVKDMGSYVRIVGVRTLTMLDFLPKPAVRLPQLDPRAYSTFSPRRYSDWQLCTASTTLRVTYSSYGSPDSTGLWPHSYATLSGHEQFQNSKTSSLA
jgi:hypothetical protein